MDVDPGASDPATRTPPSRRTLLRVVRSLWWGGLAIAAILALSLGFRQVQAAATGARPLLIVGALVLLMGQLWPSSLLWSTAIERFRDAGDAAAPSRSDVFRAAARSLPARYLPGSVWYAASRATLLVREHRVDATLLAATAVLELSLTLVAAVALGSIALLASGRPVLDPILLAVASVGALVAVVPPVLNRILAVVARRRGTVALTVRWSDLGALGGWVCLHWLWSTASFLVYLRAFPSLSDAPLATLAGAFLLSWAIGFLTILAPQGAGVFEVTLATLLASAAATGVATPTAALILGGHRGLVVVRDVLLAGGANLWQRRARTRSLDG